METVVADTCALVSLAIPTADANYETTVDPDPLQYFLTGAEVLVPLQVERELHEMAGYDDIRAAATTNVLSASEHYTRIDPLNRTDTPAELPDHGLDGGETAGIVLANALDVDAFLTDEFRNLARVHALRASSWFRHPDCCGTTPETGISDPTRLDF
nr:hypothetical protein [Halorhabdus amylolytica]